MSNRQPPRLCSERIQERTNFVRRIIDDQDMRRTVTEGRIKRHFHYSPVQKIP
ncbi:hypothetical protein NAU58_16870 [Pseudomonas stutzeri]|uniref:hypothetical protein n=1 Tax=Stutzerimonas stutzeri TaxID=316 RepID=UPI00210B3B21|nr:hypothetical protein [Stutzerimonas stutzeri]MCQ4297251.1 hypothetical protein [Stutzerimonas stutzeri]